MNLKPFIIIILLLHGLFPDAYTQQDVRIRKREFKTMDQGFKDAWKAIKKGEQAFRKGGVFYRDALESYLEASGYNEFYPELNYKIGICYYFTGNYNMALDHLNKAYELNKNVAEDISYFTGRSFQLRYEFDNAIAAYNRYKDKVSSSASPLPGQIDRMIAACRRAKEMVANPVNVHIDNLEDPINTAFDDICPVTGSDEKRMYFSSRRPVTEKEKINPFDFRYYEKVFETFLVNAEWQSPIPMNRDINAPFHNNVALQIRQENTRLLLYRSQKDEGDIMESEMEEGVWREAEKLSRRINTRSKETDIHITGDERMLFFVSERKESLGGKDIFVMKKKAGGKWGKPENMGPMINTKADEEGVFFHEASRTLYFGSKGHRSMGGYDLFKAEMKAEDEWGEAENLGYPVNSPADDLFLTVDDNKRTGYFSSNRAAGKGGFDIYRATFIGPDKKMLPSVITQWIAVTGHLREDYFKAGKQTRGASITIVTGYVKDSKDSSAISAGIGIVDSQTNTTLKSTRSDSVTGAYLFTLKAGNQYGIVVSTEDYLYHSEYFDIPESAKYQEIEKDIYLTRIEIGSKVILKNIYFEEGESTLRPESFVELGFVVNVLKNNPSIEILISGHTDNVGGYAENMRLSRERAESVVDYLVENGIDKDRLESKGYGFTVPIASNETEEGRQKNRRVEFEITGK